MGDDAAASKGKAKRVRVRVRSNAHVDVADLAEGSVSKTQPLELDAKTAADLLARHPYLEATEG
jgi:hypothetical protein